MDSIVNNYAFANDLDQFKVKILDPQQKRVDEAWKIMSDIHYPWKDEEQKKMAQTKLDNYKLWLDFYKQVHESGRLLCSQHERLVDLLSQLYERWYNDVSNNGKQESEIMTMQADILCEIFGEIYKVLRPLDLEGLKPPQALNL